MEEEINLRPFIEALLRNWMWIVGAGVLAGLLALGASFLKQPAYEATALVAVTDPQQIVQFDPRIQAEDKDLPYKAYPELATSDELLLSLLNEVTTIAPDVTRLSNLRGIVSAESGSDPSLLRLSVQYGEPETASAIANKWAEMFVTKTNEVFGSQGSEQLAFFEDQLSSASQELQQAEQDQIDFEAQNRSTILGNELSSLQRAQTDQLAKQRQIGLILQDAESLHEQLRGTSDGKASPTADQLAAILLQLRAFGGIPGSGDTPWQLQLNVDQMSGTDQQEQIAIISGLQNSMTAQVKQISEHLARLEPQILTVQQDKQEADTEGARLMRNLDVSKETYMALASKVQEEKITSQNTESGVRLASRSAVPFSTSGPRKLFVIAGGALAGIFIAVFVILVLTWWRGD